MHSGYGTAVRFTALGIVVVAELFGILCSTKNTWIGSV